MIRTLEVAGQTHQVRVEVRKVSVDDVDYEAETLGAILTGQAPSQAVLIALTLEELLAASEDWERDAARMIDEPPVLLNAERASRPFQLMLYVLGSDPSARRTVLRERLMPRAVLRWLWQGESRPNSSIALAVLRHPACPPELLAEAVYLPLPQVRIDLCRNPNLPLPLLMRLLEDEEKGIRVSAAAHRHLPEQVMRAIVADPADDRRRGVAINPRAPQDLLRSLAEESIELKVRVAGNSACPPDLVREMAASNAGGQGVLARLALNPATPPEVLEQIAKSFRSGRTYEVLRRIAYNPNTPEPALVELAAHHNYEVQRYAKARLKHKNRRPAAIDSGHELSL